MNQSDAGIGSNQPETGSLTPVAQYLRMSTENQRYSASIQAKTIADYAAANGMEVVRTYADLGRSGLDIEGRPGLRSLLLDVQRPGLAFNAVLVHDISRWGRFQDPDEAAGCELACKRYGVRVIYCAEPFANDGSLSSVIMVALKRSMAAEFSRELSAKVFAGHCESIERGFRQGGRPGFGLSRQLVDEDRKAKAVLTHGQRKYLQNDRVVLVPSSAADQAVVNLIYAMLIEEDLPVKEIAARMNALGIFWAPGRPWNWWTIHQVLTSEKYIGTNLYNRRTARLRTATKKNPPELWIRREKAFEPLVTEERFAQAGQVLKRRAAYHSSEHLLQMLRELLQKEGRLSMALMRNAAIPASTTYTARFGSLRDAFRLVGYEPGRNTDFVDANRQVRGLRSKIISDVIVGIERAGGFATPSKDEGVLEVNGELTVAVVLATAGPLKGHREWRVQQLGAVRADLLIVVRMDDDNQRPFDYYVFPAFDFKLCGYPIREENGRDVDVYRLGSLDLFFALMARAPNGQASPGRRQTIEIDRHVDHSLSMEHRLPRRAIAARGRYNQKMRHADLLDLYQRAIASHKEFQRKAEQILEELHGVRALLLDLSRDPVCSEMLSAPGAGTTPELLRCWGTFVEHA